MCTIKLPDSSPPTQPHLAPHILLFLLFLWKSLAVTASSATLLVPSLHLNVLTHLLPLLILTLSTPSLPMLPVVSSLLLVSSVLLSPVDSPRPSKEDLASQGLSTADVFFSKVQSRAQHSIAQHSTAQPLYCTALHCTALYCISRHCATLHRIALSPPNGSCLTCFPLVTHHMSDLLPPRYSSHV
jgi:hypothetical protein